MSYIHAVDRPAVETRNASWPADEMYRTFHGCRPAQVVRAPCRRTVPPVLVGLGSLRGLIYRANRGDGLRTYIHFLEDEPWLTCTADGTQLYIVGGKYRITRRGIEG